MAMAVVEVEMSAGGYSSTAALALSTGERTLAQKRGAQSLFLSSHREHANTVCHQTNASTFNPGTNERLPSEIECVKRSHVWIPPSCLRSPRNTGKRQETVWQGLYDTCIRPSDAVANPASGSKQTSSGQRR